MNNDRGTPGHLHPTPTDTTDGLPLPSLDTLSEAQVRGKACVWCTGTLNNGTAIDLGARPVKYAGRATTSWFPRGCRRCTAIEVVGPLDAHTASCVACNTLGGICSTGGWLASLRRQALR